MAPKMKPDAGVSCATCRHFKDRTEAGEDKNGECRRYPPQFFALDEEVCCQFPVVTGDESCGEYSPVLN